MSKPFTKETWWKMRRLQARKMDETLIKGAWYALRHDMPIWVVGASFSTRKTQRRWDGTTAKVGEHPWLPLTDDGRGGVVQSVAETKEED